MSVKINGIIDVDESVYQFQTSRHVKAVKNTLPKYQIPPHPGFETVKTPDNNVVKIAYNKIYPAATEDLEIELLKIYQLEKRIDSIVHVQNSAKFFPSLKFHYKKAISLISPKMAAGWNRWSDNILDLFIMEKIHKVLWGSGNCGKSAVMATLLYTKWRANPSERMVVIASKVMQDASARVYGYIKNIHIDAPKSTRHDFRLVDGVHRKGIYCLKWDNKEGKYVINDQACIINLPVKVNAQTTEIGANLLGKHPDDRLILAFDEAQELPASMLNDKIFLNWYTNERLDVYAWGNPSPIDFATPGEWDLLFKLGAAQLSKATLKRKEKAATKTDVWKWSDTIVLRFTMLDSPKDDPEEANAFVERSDGTKVQRLWFLAGRDNVRRIAEKVSPKTPSWYSQVLGFPFLHVMTSTTQGTVTPILVRESRLYPLVWKQGSPAEYFMGVDPAASGKNDAASIVVCKMGKMDDGRMGVDLMHGKGCMQVELQDGVDFIDSTVETMYSLALRYNIPLHNIAVETHGVGEAIRYALMRHVEDGKWKEDHDNGRDFYIVSPVGAISDRKLIRTLGKEVKASEIVKDINTELWYAVRCLFLTRQIFNVPEVIIQQLMQRHMIPIGGQKYKLETKEQLYKRGIKSPNDADALTNAVDLMIGTYRLPFRNVCIHHA